jgi:membrane protease YdiL (CAAX protease family)
VFVGVLVVAIRPRGDRPWARIVGLACVVVIGGMVFARWGQNTGLPWFVYYTLPALLTLLAPPLVLRMTAREAVPYLLMAVLMAPAIHVFFSAFLDWHDYMPFFDVPSLADMFRRS